MSPAITLGLARRRRACEDGIRRGLAALGRVPGDDEPVRLVDLLDGGLLTEDVAWAVSQAREGRPVHRAWMLDLFQGRREAALVVLPIFERQRPADARPRAALSADAATAAAAIRAAHAADAARAARAAHAAGASYPADASYAAYAAYTAAADRESFRSAFRGWCRARLRARLVGGDVPPVPADAALAAVLAPLGQAVAARLGGGQ